MMEVKQMHLDKFGSVGVEQVEKVLLALVKTQSVSKKPNGKYYRKHLSRLIYDG